MKLPNEFHSEIENAHFDPHSPIPLYHQAYVFIRELISKELLKPGDMLPSEIELAQSLKIGRQTLRQAMSKLVEVGLVERFSGRGTFVRSDIQKRDFYLDRSFSQEMAELGKKARSKILHISHDVIDERAPLLLQTKMGAPCLYLTRLRYGDNIPIGLQEAIILTERCPDLDKHDFTQESLFRVLSEVYKFEISEIYHIVNAIIADEEKANLLKIETGAPLLFEKSVTFLSNGEPIESTTSYFRADKYQYSVRFKYLGSKNNSIK